MGGHGNTGRYSGVAISLHWMIAMMVLLLVILGLTMTDIPRGTPERSMYYNFHKSVGLTVGILMLVRLWWRWRCPPPPLPTDMPRWQVVSSKISHGLLYACLFIMPLSGFAATQFTKWGLKYFGLFKIPPMAFVDKSIYKILQEIHQILGWLLMFLITIHILAAIKHSIFDENKIMQRIVIPKD